MDPNVERTLITVVLVVAMTTLAIVSGFRTDVLTLTGTVLGATIAYWFRLNGASLK